MFFTESSLKGIVRRTVTGGNDQTKYNKNMNNNNNNKLLKSNKIKTNDYGWVKTSYLIPSSLLTIKLFKIHFRKFWFDFSREYSPSVKNNTNQIFLMVFVKYRSGQIKALGKASKVSRKDSSQLLNNIISFLRIKSDSYMNEPIDCIYFHFKFVPISETVEGENAQPIIHHDRNPEYFNPATVTIGEYNLPNNMNILGGARPSP